MSIPRIVKAQPLNDYKIRLEFADGVTGEVDLSHLVGKGVFARWNNYGNFKKVSFEGGRWLAWSDDIDIDADTLYMKVTGKTPGELFPILKQDLAYA
jgi:hypothetical protein